MALQEHMLALPDEVQIQLETRHTFAPGIYIREMVVPKDTIVIGKVPKTEYLNIVSKGAMSVATEAGMKRFEASDVVRTKPGLKRAAQAHEDSVWVTIHQNPTNERDIDKLEDMLFADTFEGFPAVADTTDEQTVITYKGKQKSSPQIDSGTGNLIEGENKL